MAKKNKAAQALAQLSVSAREHKWGKREFRRKMQEWGELGGRPKLPNSCTKYPSHRFSLKTGKCYGCKRTRKELEK